MSEERKHERHPDNDRRVTPASCGPAFGERRMIDRRFDPHDITQEEINQAALSKRSTDDCDITGMGLALQFHETYERLAPSFGYETRVETRAFDPQSKNGRLMIAVCAELIDRGIVR